MSAYSIKGSEGVIINSDRWLELPKASTKHTTFVEREGMIRYNKELKSFEGVIGFTDNSVAYRRFANLDENGLLLTSQLPPSITSGLDYMGTYSPLVDDVVPPNSGLTPLPSPDASNAGQYLIVRGIYDAAMVHYAANPTSPSPTKFTPVNPNGQGNWIEIKYYLGVDPMDASKKMVQVAYGRIITAAIPSGHSGLVSLAQDPELTVAFTNDNTPMGESALTDGDWIISDGTRMQRLRQNRVSIAAASVLYDRGVVISAGRAYPSSASTVQSVLDQGYINGFRRTGDSMYDDGGKGKGRLGVVLGTATEPAIAFNGTDTIGVDPSKWSDTNTGMYSPGKGKISFTSNGVSQIDIEPSLTKFHGVVNVDSHTNVGGNLAVTGTGLITGDLTVNGNTGIKLNLTVDGSATIKTNLVLNGTFTIGTTNATTITQTSPSLNLAMSNFADVQIMDGAAIRTKFNRYGLKFPVLATVDNSVGENGMIAFNDAGQQLLQKLNGIWQPVGGANFSTVPFAVANWVLNGAYYTYTISRVGVRCIDVQEQVGSNYVSVGVDSITYSGNNAIISIPAAPDIRFAGRVIVSFQP